VGIFSRLHKTPVKPEPEPPPSTEAFSWAPGRQPWLPGGTYVGTAGWASRVSRDEAISVPAVKRGRDLICSVGSLPLRMVSSTNEVTPSPLLRQIDPNTSNVVTLSQTLDDLLFEGVAWWEIISFGWDGFPVSARHLDVHAVSTTPPAGYPVQTLPSGLYPAGVVWVMGREIDAKNVVRFDSPNDPLTTAGARAVRRAIKLAQTSEMYADDPEARAYWTPRGDVDPGDRDTIVDHLTQYAAARRAGSEAYIPAALDRHLPQAPSAVDIQLAQLQQRSDLEIANLLGIDPEDIGVNVTSRTYANITDRRTDRINNVLAPYMASVTDRLSLNDVTKRGYRVAFDLDNYLKADPATRWSTYGTAIDKGIMSVEEIRERESLPPGVPTPPAPVPSPTPGVSVQTRGGFVSMSAVNDPVTVTFSTLLTVSKEKRTISGTVLPFNVPTDDSRKYKFVPGSVTWDSSAVGRIKLDREHDLRQLLGSATDLTADDTGIIGRFRIARTSAGDEALALAEDGALDGLSAVVEILSVADDTADDGTTVITGARLRRVTLTADPAFSDARVTTVAARAVRPGEEPMSVTTSVIPDPGPVEAFTSAVEAFTSAVEALGAVPAEQRSTVTPVVAVREPLVYSLAGVGPSFVRDAWDARHAGYGSSQAEEAVARLRRYGEQTAQLAAAATHAQFVNTGDTTDQAQIIPPGYRPDLYVGQVPQGRPLRDSIGTRVTLANATPFKVPVWVGSSGLSGTNVEGTGPSTGTMTNHTYLTVTPTAQSGEFVIVRELMDSSNPAVDVIAMNAMREEYAQDTEAVIATALAAATDDNTGSGQSTEGCYVYSVTGTGNDLMIDGVREMSADYGAHRFLEPDTLLASPTGFKALTKAIDDIGRPIAPFMAGQNAMGTYGRARRVMDVDGFAVPNVWSMTSTYDDLLMFVSTDLLVGESPLLTFRFEEKGGPENIYLNTWGYFAFQILRYTGIHACNYTSA